MPKVTIIRHAQSLFNAFGNSTRNVGLSEYGVSQCANLEGTYDTIVCSTLFRARQTLDYSKITYKRIVFTDLCREVKDNNPVNLYNGEDNTVENHDVVKQRIVELKQLLTDLTRNGERVAMISHYCFLYAMIGYGVNNAGVREYEF